MIPAENNEALVESTTQATEAIDWFALTNALKTHYDDGTYRGWLQALVFAGFNAKNGEIAIAAKTTFIRDWLNTYFMDDILLLWQKLYPSIQRVKLITLADMGVDETMMSSGMPLSNISKPIAAPDQAAGLNHGVNQLHAQNLSSSSLSDAVVESSEAMPKPILDLKSQNVTPLQRKNGFEQKRSESLSPVASMSNASSHGVNNVTGLAGFQKDMEQKRVDDAIIQNPLDISIQSIQLDPKMTFDNFVIGRPNEFAAAAAEKIASSADVSYNPLFLYGGVGLGKTHLMHAIAWKIRQTQPHRKVLYLTAESFMFSFIRSLRMKETIDFKELFRSVDVLMVDDVQFIAGRSSTQEEFFHTFNSLVDQNRQVIISADKSPSDLEGMEDRLKSRLGWGLVADIHPTTHELRLGILQSKAEKSPAKVHDDVLAFLATKVTSNVRELEGALNRLIAHVTFVGGEVTIDLAQDVLSDLFRSNERRVSIDEIKKIVSEHFNIKISDMHSSKRQRSIALPRQIAMYLSKELTPHSFPEIGRNFGGKDHSTVMHAVKKIQEALQKNSDIQEDVQLLLKMLKSQ